jgi:hypothetical protein
LSVRYSVLVCLALLVGCAPVDPLGEPLGERATTTPQVVVSIISQVPTQLISPSPPVIQIGPSPIYELGAGQHISADGNYRDTETEAAGPMVCQIQRNSSAFQQLVSDYDSRVLWNEGSGSEYNDENHLFHPDLLPPLNTLIDLVAHEWQGQTQIMITAAYDSEGKHDLAQLDQNNKYSLHFEGRSIDLIPWPPDLLKVARLCALTHQAGFDWVHNEEDHCHASVKAQSLCDLYDYRGP